MTNIQEESKVSKAETKQTKNIPPPHISTPQDDGISPEVQEETTRRVFAQSIGGASISPGREGVKSRSLARGKRDDGEPTAESKATTTTHTNNDTNIGDGNGDGGKSNNSVGGSKSATAVDCAATTNSPATTGTGTGTAGKGYDDVDNEHQHQQPGNGLESYPSPVDDDGVPDSSSGWKPFGGGSSHVRRRGRRGNKKILPSEGGFDESAGRGEAMTNPLVLPDQELSSQMT